MTFEISERFTSASTEQEVLGFLKNAFQKVSEGIIDNDSTFTAKQLNATFGSINRADETTISVSRRDSDLLVVASVNYKPSIAFWIIFIICLFSTVGWLIPLVFYFYQKKTVREAVEEVFARTRNEFSGSRQANPTPPPIQDTTSQQQPGGQGVAEQLERLGALVEKGLLSKEEFDAQKKKLLGL